MTYFLLFAAAFSMGLLGSPHCLGMCGGIVTAFGMSMQSLPAGRQRLLIALYHLGRLGSYSLLGLLAGVVGTAVIAPFVHSHFPRLLLGAVLIVIGLSLFGLPLLNRLERMGLKFWQSLMPFRRRLFPLDSVPKAVTAGLLWGFLPCGLVYGALLMAVAGHDTLTGAGLMLAFGLGTLPMLLATQQMVSLLRHIIGKFHLRQFNGALLMISGVMVMVMPLMMSHMGHSHDIEMGSEKSEISHQHASPDQPTEPVIQQPADHSHHHH